MKKKNKSSYISFNLLLQFFKYKEFLKVDNFKIWSKSSTILPIMIDSIVFIYNGRKFIPLYITDLMMGHKLGEFIFTRTFKGHTNKMEKKKNIRNLKVKK